MKRYLLFFFLFISFAPCTGVSLSDFYKNNFHGFVASGFTNKSITSIDAGIQLKWKNWYVFNTLKYYSDEKYEMYGLNGTTLLTFPILKSRLKPFLQLASSLNHAKSRTAVEINNSIWIWNEMSVALGGGLLVELNKRFILGASLNYEMIGVFSQKVYFNLQPLVSLQYALVTE